ncbi:MAG: dihydrolipoyllysine-residue succinyltransferase [candidate division Zixibacteria bacterium]|nr:dihydrolipoyllysine-residue succinyltransferase [candidate division Zixibacteria bacterium]MBU1470692.1 dihydrolipoyllysine-residue succinyltransferase [candidate division Zixibacteria bacterium]MBU2625002.1 dihydrolipoyllysine-residue succinyltransferase [candidate division Zixibacteria bacterium]
MIIELKVPSPGESITEVEVVKWMKADGEYVYKDELLCEIESEKVTLALHAEESGKLKILVGANSTVAVGTVACTIDTDAKPDPSSAPVSKEPVVESQVVSQPEVKADDEEKPVRMARPVATTPTEATPADIRPIRREKMTQLRQKVSQRLVAVKNRTAMLTTFNEVDMTRVKRIRAEYRERFEQQHGVRLGFMSFFAKAVCEAIRDFPAVNAMIDGGEIIFHDYVDIGIAVSAKKGLMVPIIRDAHRMTFAEIEKAIIDLSTKARESKLTMDELTGGTFTITNGGVFGSMLSTPILNPPQSAILGMHTIQDRPVAIDGQVVIRPMMYLALSYDHRIIDGMESVSFLKRIKEMLEDPVRMLLNVTPDNR